MTESMGLDYAAKLSYKLIDESLLKEDEKRNLLFSLYCFRGIFDNRSVLEYNAILVKYKISFILDIEKHPDFESFKDKLDCLSEARLLEGGGVALKRNGKVVLKVDCGDGAYKKLAKRLKLAALPELYSLYEMVDKIVGLDNASIELLAIWYQMYPYIVLIETPHEEDLFNRFKDALCNESVYNQVLKSKYSINIPGSVKEMWAMELPSRAVDWYLDYDEYINQNTEKGITRVVEQLQLLLSRGDFNNAFLRSEKLLDTQVDDENILLVNIASRVSLCDKFEDKGKLLNETLGMLKEILSVKREKKIYFIYYTGLVQLALKDISKARAAFMECLKLDERFELASFMLKSLDKMQG